MAELEVISSLIYQRYAGISGDISRPHISEGIISLTSQNPSISVIKFLKFIFSLLVAFIIFMLFKASSN